MTGRRLLGRRKPKRVRYAVQISAGNFFRTADSGGETGDPAGFGGLYLCRVKALDAAAQQFFGGRRATGGWQVLLGTTGLLSCFMWTSSSTFVQASGAFPPTKFGRLCVIGFQHTGALLRVFLDRLEVLGSAAITGFYAASPATQWEYMGVNSANGEPSTLIDHVGKLTWRGVPSDAQLLTALDSLRALGDMPTSIPGATITNRQSVREALAAAAVVDGQLAPASLPDTVNGLASMRFDRVGSPVVREIPTPTRIVTQGICGFSATARYQSAVALLNNPTLSIEISLTFNTALVSGKHVLSDANGSGTVGGISIYQSASTLNVYSYGAGAIVAQVNLASEVGYRRTIKVEFTGSVWRLYVDGVQRAADGAGTFTPSTLPLCVGSFGDGTGGADNVSIWSLRLGTYADPNQHFYDFTPDVLDNGGAQKGAPITVADRFGTANLTRIGGYVVDAGGLRDTGAAQPGQPSITYIRALIRALTGNTTAFWAECLTYRFSGMISGQSAATVFGESDGSLSAGGWRFSEAGGNAWVQVKANGAVQTFSLAAWATPGLNHVAFRYDGSKFYCFLNGVLRQTSAAGMVFEPATTGATAFGTSWGAGTGTYSAFNHAPKGGSGGNQLVSDAEIIAAANSALSTGKVVGIAGKTDVRWSIADDIIEAGGLLPGAVKERVSGANGMIVVSPSMQVAQRNESLWSWEVSPTMQGAQNFSSANRYESALNMLGGNASMGFCGGALFRPDSQSVASVVRRLFAARSDDAFGWEMGTSNAHATLFVTAYNGTTGYGAPSYTITAQDVGKLLLAMFVWDPISAKLRMYVKRAEIGSGTAITGSFTPKTGVPAMIGDKAGISRPFDNATVYGVVFANGVPTLAQLQAHHDQVMAGERMVQIPGLAGTVIDFTQDGGAAATLTDRDVGGVNFTRIGAPTTAPHYLRAA